MSRFPDPGSVSRTVLVGRQRKGGRWWGRGVSVAEVSLQPGLARTLRQAYRCRDRHAHKEKRADQLSPRRRRCFMLETIRHGPQSIMQTRKTGSQMSLLEPEKTGPGKRRPTSTEEGLGQKVSRTGKKEKKNIPLRGRGILGSGVQRQIRSCVVVVSMGRGRWWPPPPGPPAAELLVAVVGVFRVRSSMRGSLGLRRN